MNLFRAEEWWGRSELMIDFVLKAALVVGLAAFSLWLWPDGILETPLGLIKLRDWLWAGGALWAGALCVLVFYFVRVEPAISRVKDNTDTVEAEAKIGDDDLEGQRDIVGELAVIKSESARKGASESSG